MRETREHPEHLAYRDALILALRLKDVPGDRIGEIVAEVESHVAETGEDPVEAFGPARAYAASLTAEHRRSPWWQTALLVVGAGLAGFALAQGALAVLLGEPFLGRSGWLWLALGLAAAVPTAVSVRRQSNRIVDPRTGADLVEVPRWAKLALVALPVAIVLSGWLVIVLTG